MKKMIAIALSLAFVLAFAGCAATNSGENKLTLEKVKELAEKGENLSWSDFEQYDHKDVGSGMYVYSYDIDKNFCLFIGGPNPQDDPLYIRLIHKGENGELVDNGEYIDIRTESIDDFINSLSD